MTRLQPTQAKKLKGFRDLLPDQASQRKAMIDLIWHNAERAGFLPIETPVLEYAETLLGTGNQDTDKEIYRFDDHGGRSVGMRFDLTVPFARFIAEHQGTLTFPFKKLQIGNSWRGEKPQKGRYREFCQADLDIIGVDSAAADIEVLSTIHRNLNTLIPSPYTMSIGHRKVLSALISYSFPDLAKELESRVLVALDKTDKIGVEKVRELILAIEGCSETGVDTLQSLLQNKTKDGDSDLESLMEIFANQPEVVEEMKRLQTTVKIVKELGRDSHGRTKIDLNIARGLGYYTGIVFETMIDALPGFGSVSSGGRYNDLVSRFSSQSLPGIGGSIGVDRLLSALEELVQEKESKRQGIFVAVATEDALEYGFALVNELRNQCPHLIDVALKTNKLAPQFKFADRRGYAKVITVGTEEMQKQTFSIKDLATGEEKREIKRASLISILTD